MTRNKVMLAFIQNDSARKTTFKKRCKGIMKKVEELSTLCGVDACAIVYSPYGGQPKTWPPYSILVQNVLSEFRNKSEIDQSKKMVNQETFLQQRISKALDQLRKILRNSREIEIGHLMTQILLGNSYGNLNRTNLTDLYWMAEQRLKSVNHRLDVLRKNNVPVLQRSSGDNVVAATFDPTVAQRQWDATQMAARQQLGTGEMAPFEDFNGNNMAGVGSSGANLSPSNYFPWN